MSRTYDFETIMDRTGKDAIAVELIPVQGATVKEGYSKIPMWVADMNFATAPSVITEIAKRVQHPAFGYFNLSEEYFKSIIGWQENRNGVTGLSKEHIGYENGVLGCVMSTIGAFCTPGDRILLHAPTYIGFTGSIENGGYRIVTSELKRDSDGIWRMDYDDMDQKIKENHIHMAVFCSPHNPCGRVWEKEEIQKAMEVYQKNDCIVISDEIWSDIILNGNKHIPTQSVSEDAKNRTIAVYAPSKTFNLASLVGSYHIIYNDFLRDQVWKKSLTCHYNECNVLSMHALIGAYKEAGSRWVDELREVLSENINYAYDFITSNFKGVSLTKPEGTYMLYLDCSEWLKEHAESLDNLLKAGIEVGVIWQDGRPFKYPDTIRMNLAVPHSLVVEAMARLRDYVFA